MDSNLPIYLPLFDNIINIYEKEKLTILKSEIIQKLNNTNDVDEIKIFDNIINIFKIFLKKSNEIAYFCVYILRV